MNHIARQKTLAERLDWMAKNLPGFADELAAVEAIQRRAIDRQAILLKRSAEEHSDAEHSKKAGK